MYYENDIYECTLDPKPVSWVLLTWLYIKEYKKSRFAWCFCNK